jgi:hypothetical protein
VHSLKDSIPIEVTLVGKEIFFSEVQPLKERSPNDVTETGIVTDTKNRQFKKTPLGIVEKVLGIVIDVKLEYENAPSSIDVRLFGSIIDNSEVHCENAYIPIDVRLFGSVTEDIEEHFEKE